MKKTAIAAVTTMLFAATSAYAGNICVSIALNDTFLAVMIHGMTDEAAKSSQPRQFEIVGGDVSKRMSQVQNFDAA